MKYLATAFTLFSLLSACSYNPTHPMGTVKSSAFQVGQDKWFVRQIDTFQASAQMPKQMLFFDPQSASSVAMIQHKSGKISDFETKQLAQKFNYSPTGGYCEVFVFEAKSSQRPADLPPGCEPVYSVRVNGSEVARFPVYYPGNPNNTSPEPANYYQVYAPCSNACQVPLQVNVLKIPGDQCQLQSDGQYNTGDPSSSSFEVSACPAPQPAPSGVLYHPEYMGNLLDAGNGRLFQIESDVESLIKATQEQFPDVGNPPEN